MCMTNRTRYIIVKNELHTLTRNLRINFEMNMALNIKNKPKPFWSYVRSKMKSKRKIPPLNKPDDTKAFDAKDKAETLNSFFSSIFTTSNGQHTYYECYIFLRLKFIYYQSANGLQ